MGNELNGTVERICWRIVDAISLALEPSERLAVRGDLAECGDPAPRAIVGVAGLVIRRQVELWNDWRPWLALVGLSLVSGVILSEVLSRFNQAFFEWIDGFSNYRTPDQDILYLLSLMFALITFSWLSGFVLAALSGRTAWLTAGLFYFIVLNAFTGWWLIHGLVHGTARVAPGVPLVLFILNRIVPFQNIGSVLLFMLPGYLGLVQGASQRTFTPRFTIGMVLTVSLLIAFLTWTSGFYEYARAEMSNGMYSAQPWRDRLWPLIVLAWPTIYVSARRTRTSTPPGRRPLVN